MSGSPPAPCCSDALHHTRTQPEPCARHGSSLMVLTQCSLLLPQEMRSLMTDAFRAKAGTPQVHTTNRLIVQGRMELEETLMLVCACLQACALGILSHSRTQPAPHP